MNLPDSEIMQVLQNLVIEMQAWWPVIFKLSYLFGFVFIISSLTLLASHEGIGGRNQTNLPTGKVMGTAMCGLFLLNLPGLLDMASYTMFREDSLQELSYIEGQVNDSEFAVYFVFALSVVVLVGLIAVIKGCVLLKHSMEDSRQAWQALGHIIGGTLCVNIYMLVEMLAKIMGGNFEAQIKSFL